MEAEEEVGELVLVDWMKGNDKLGRGRVIKTGNKMEVSLRERHPSSVKQKQLDPYLLILRKYT